MPPNSPPPAPSPRRDAVAVEDLLAHAGWVRGLAGSLVRDPWAAEDLAQETLLTAVERPPAVGGSVRAWLAGVLRNLLRERRRGDGAFALRAPAPGAWRVMIAAPDGGLRVFDGVGVPAGGTEWTLDLALGAVAGHAPPGGDVVLVAEGPGERWALATAPRAGDGAFAVPRFPAGRARVVLADEVNTPRSHDPLRWPAWREVLVPEGGTGSVE